MTCIERWKEIHPGSARPELSVIRADCPSQYGIMEDPDEDGTLDHCCISCEECWNRTIPTEQKMVWYNYEVNVGSGSGTGSVLLPDNATDDEIRLAIMDDLYDVTYEKEQKEC